MNKQPANTQSETVAMTKRMYRHYEKEAAAAGTTVLVYLRRTPHISSRRALRVTAFNSVDDVLPVASRGGQS